MLLLFGRSKPGSKQDFLFFASLILIRPKPTKPQKKRLYKESCTGTRLQIEKSFLDSSAAAIRLKLGCAVRDKSSEECWLESDVESAKSSEILA